MIDKYQHQFQFLIFQLNEKLRNLQTVEQQINEYNVILAKAKGLPILEGSKTSAARKL